MRDLRRQESREPVETASVPWSCSFLDFENLPASAIDVHNHILKQRPYLRIVKNTYVDAISVRRYHQMWCIVSFKQLKWSTDPSSTTISTRNASRSVRFL